MVVPWCGKSPFLFPPDTNSHFNLSLRQNWGWLPFFSGCCREEREGLLSVFSHGRALAKEKSLLIVDLIYMRCKDCFLPLLIGVWSINVVSPGAAPLLVSHLKKHSLGKCKFPSSSAEEWNCRKSNELRTCTYTVTKMNFNFVSDA